MFLRRYVLDMEHVLARIDHCSLASGRRAESRESILGMKTSSIRGECSRSGKESSSVVAWPETTPPAMCERHQHDCWCGASRPWPSLRHQPGREGRPARQRSGQGQRRLGPREAEVLSLLSLIPPWRSPGPACIALACSGPPVLMPGSVPSHRRSTGWKWEFL